MISLKNEWNLQPNNVGNLGKIIVATGLELLPKVKKIAQSGHAVTGAQSCPLENSLSTSNHAHYGKISFEVLIPGNNTINPTWP